MIKSTAHEHVNTFLNVVKVASLAGVINFGMVSSSHAISALTFSGTSTNITSTTSTRGYAFNVLNPAGITVTDLSFWDQNADGLSQAHDVGLWNSAGTLLASATVNAGLGSPLSANGQFRTAPISNLFLAQGNNYVVGAVFLSGSPDLQNISSSFTTIPDIAFVNGRVINNGNPSLTLPTSTFDNPFIGGSFEATPVVAVPFEFSPTLGLSVVGGLWIGKRLIKQIKSAKTKV